MVFGFLGEGVVFGEMVVGGVVGGGVELGLDLDADGHVFGLFWEGGGVGVCNGCLGEDIGYVAHFRSRTPDVLF